VLDQVVLSRVVARLAAVDPGRLCYVFENRGHGVEKVTAGDLARNGSRWRNRAPGFTADRRG
jgi:hypothetical protein